MSEVAVAIEPHTPVAAERLDALAGGLADDLRTVRGLRVGHAGSTAVGPGKSPQAWELGMLVVSGVFSAATMGAIAQIAVAYINRANARSIRLRSGENEIEITGSTRLDDPVLVAQLEKIFGTGSAPASGAPAPLGGGDGPRAVEGDRGADTGR
ncbi:hypothetical protein AB0J90_04320 [Micromonospora sp. NPDC049523]|uniref:hypothetical protein n=1 Tax=Micromonospora sp. NPDC049523 TaxID=3155921 RepID=UPI003415BA2C